MNTAEEDALADRVLQGDVDALQQLLLLRYEWLLAYVQRELRARNARDVIAEDVVQDACCKIFRAATDFRAQNRGGLFAWFKKIVHNQLVDALRRQHQQRPADLPGAAAAEMTESRPVQMLLEELAVATDPRASVVIRHQELRQAFYAALEGMSAEHREVIQLLYFEDLTVEEAAERMGKTPDAVRGLRQRARERLKQAVVRLSRYT